MSRDGTIEVEHLWKGFAADRGRRLFRDQVGRVAARALRRGVPDSHRWVLRDVTFHVAPGEAVGLVGRNGSGKSTLLRLLSRVMYPGYGRADVFGRVGALIEVTSGIHPDLTGRENVAVYGSLLGWRRAEVMRKFDEIVAFAEVEDAIERQVKFYSSGMKMRLGFAIAAFLEPPILLVDEVLAVGDAAFQQKCLDRMRRVLQSGTTVIFVSHDLNAVRATCERGLWLADGVLAADGPVEDALDAYRSQIEAEAETAPDDGGAVRGVGLTIVGRDGGSAATNEPCRLEIELESAVDAHGVLMLGVTEGEPAPIFVLRHETAFSAGRARHLVDLPHLPLPGGRFYVWYAAQSDDGEELAPWQPLGPMPVAGPELGALPAGMIRRAPVFVDARWQRQG